MLSCKLLKLHSLAMTPMSTERLNQGSRERALDHAVSE